MVMTISSMIQMDRLIKIITIIRKYHQIQAAKIMIIKVKISRKVQNLKIITKMRFIRLNIIQAVKIGIMGTKPIPWRKWTSKRDQ